MKNKNKNKKLSSVQRARLRHCRNTTSGCPGQLSRASASVQEFGVLSHAQAAKAPAPSLTSPAASVSPSHRVQRQILSRHHRTLVGLFGQRPPIRAQILSRWCCGGSSPSHRRPHPHSKPTTPCLQKGQNLWIQFQGLQGRLWRCLRHFSVLSMMAITFGLLLVLHTFDLLYLCF